MRKISTPFLTTLCLLLALLLGGFWGWQSRHQWLPWLANHWLEGIQVKEISALELTDGGKGLTLRQALLRLSSGQELRIQNLRLANWPALTGMSDTPARLTIENITALPATSPPEAQIPANTTAGTTTDDQAPAANNSAQQRANGTGKDTPSPLTLSGALKTLQSLKLEQIDLESVTWPDVVTGSFTATLTHQDGDIRGTVRYSECSDCALSLTLDSNPDELSLTAQIETAGERVALLDVNMSANREPQVKGERFWNLDGSLQLNAGAAAEFSRKIAQNIGAAPSKLLLPQSGAQPPAGRLAVNMSAELPDQPRQTEGYRNLSAQLTADNLRWSLPAGFMAVPLPLQLAIHTEQPADIEFAQISPLRVSKAEGTLAITLDGVPLSNADATDTDTPALQFNLTMEGQQQPKASVRGKVNFSRLDQLLPPEMRANLLSGYTLHDIAGEANFHGGVDLPPIQGVARLSDLVASNIALNIEPESSIAARLAPQTPDSPFAAIGWSSAQLQVENGKPLIISAATWPGTISLESPEFAFSLQSQPAREGSRLEGHISSMRCSDLMGAVCTMGLKGHLNKLVLKDPQIQADEVAFELGLALPAQTGQNISGIQQVSFTDINFSAAELKGSDFKFLQPELFSQRIDCKRGSSEIKCAADQIALSLAPFAVPDASIEGVTFLENFSLVQQSQDIQAEASFRSDSLKITALDSYRLDVETQGRFQLANGVLAGNSQVSAGQLALDSRWQQDLNSGRGELVFTLPDTAFSPQAPLSGTIKNLPLDIVSGTVAASGKLYWQTEGQQPPSVTPASQVNLQLKNASTSVGDIFAVGIDGEIALTREGEQWRTERPAPITIQRLDAGLPIDNLAFSVSLLKNQDLRLQRFSGELLQGALTSERLTWNLNGEERHSKLAFTGLSLKALAKEMEAENFAASGLMDAVLPLTTDRQGVTIDNGTLDARAPGGRLRYYGAFSPTMLASNPQLKLIAGALEDYNYREIHGTITYPLSGDLKLNLKLTGRSDAIDANRDLIINLNLENNVPNMLKSLQASRNLTDVLEKSVQ